MLRFSTSLAKRLRLWTHNKDFFSKLCMKLSRIVSPHLADDSITHMDQPYPPCTWLLLTAITAGITLDEIRGTKTAVFAGSFTYDYQSLTNRDLAHYPKYTVTGTDANAILANRISFVFDLHGPSVQVDTACSSSLTAFHLGVQSLQTGESDMAIICGTALHFDPTIFITMAEFGMLSTDGRCRHFDAAGSGYVRGDGICAVVLKRQRAAELNGDRIRAVIRGTGTNHDGIKEGMTLPNNKAQASLVRGIYENAGLDPRDTGYFEAHGTGTQAGDPREAASIGEVFAAGRTEPLYVGSIKTNIGHLEGASGLAGIMKAMMCVERGKILPNMHFNTPNPKIDFEKLKIRVPVDTVDWQPENGIRRASINSFGFGGANSHVVLENYTDFAPEERSQSTVGRVTQRPFLLPLSSHSDSGGKMLQAMVAEYIQQNDTLTIENLVHTYSTRRSMHRFRAFAVGEDLASLSESAKNMNPLASWKQASKSPRLGFIFTGQGAQWYAMGRQLIEQNGLFKSILLECESVLKTLPDAPSWSIVDELTKSQTESRLSQSEFSQPLCTALQIALVDVLRSWGISPHAVIGHSSGEIAAAYAAGILSRRDTIICAYYRGLYMSKGKDGAPGSMMAVGLTEAEANQELALYAGRAGIAAINSPSSITLSGDKDAILEIKEKLDEKKVFARLLQVEQAFHSHHMLPLAPGFQTALATTDGFSPTEATTPMFSSVTARDSSARPMDGSYWSDNMTGRVRFSDAVTGMILGDNDEPAVDILVEIGPHPALKGPAKQTIKSLGLDLDLPYIGSLDRKLPAYESILACAGQLFSLGYNVDLVAANSEQQLNDDGTITTIVSGQNLSNVPTYAWDHKSFWAETRWNKEYRQRPYRHSLLGAPVPGSPSNNPRWRNYIHINELPWLKDHSIDGSVLFPAAGFFTLAVEALVRTVPAQELRDVLLSDVQIKAALAIPDSESGVEIMTDLLLEDTASDSGLSYRFTVYSFTDSGATVQNCSGTVSIAPAESVQVDSTFEQLQRTMNRSTPAEKFYHRVHALGLQYGDTFRLVNDALESNTGSAIASLEFDPKRVQVGDLESENCIMHPSFLDSTFHVILTALDSQFGHGLQDAFVATFCGSLRISNAMITRRMDVSPNQYWVKAETKLTSQRLSTSNLDICDAGSSTALIQVRDVEFTALGLSDGDNTGVAPFFRIEWKPAFGFLGKNAEEPEFASVDDLVACYKHQYPGNSILDLKNGEEPTDSQGSHDLVIVEDDLCKNVSSLLKPSGFVVSSKLESMEDGALQLKFQQGQLKVWQLADAATESRCLTVIQGASSSEISLRLVEHIRHASSYEKVSVTTLEQLGSSSLSASDVLVLSSLDTSISGTKDFGNMLQIISNGSNNIVWVQKNSSSNADAALHLSATRNLARVARAENADLRLALIDVSESSDTSQIFNAVDYVISSSSAEQELAIENGCLLIPRVAEDANLGARFTQAAELQPFNAQGIKASESLFQDSITSVSFEFDDKQASESLAHDEIEVAVQASMLQRESNAITSCVGAVSSAGASAALLVGKQVLVLHKNSGAHASVLRTKSSLAFALDTKALAYAMRIATPLLHAAYAIHVAARIEAGDSCLIYDAASPVGDVALSVLQSIGATVTAIVRTESERHYVTERFDLPASAVISLSNSRPDDKLLQLLGVTFWRLALNCATIQSDTFEDISKSAALSFPSQSSIAEVLASLLETNASLLQRAFTKSLKSLETRNVSVSTEEIHRLPYSQISEAMGMLASKPALQQIQLYADDTPVAVRSRKRSVTPLFDAEKTILLTGSFGDAAFSLAQWLFRRGARKLSVLANSSCDPLPQQAMAWLEQRGVSISTSGYYNTGDWVKSVDGKIGGVIQGAIPTQPLQLDDANDETLYAATQPRLKALQDLHAGTSSSDLDFFLCISSVAPVIGLSCEASHTIVNGCMNDFAAWRRQRGCPAASVSVGIVENLGRVAESEAVKESLHSTGINSITEDHFFFQLEMGILSQYPDGEADGTADHHILSGMSFSSRDEFWSSKPLFRGIYENASGSSSSSDVAKDLRSVLRDAKTAEERQSALADAFVDKISTALSISSADINIGLPLSSYGMDSLAAVDFRKWFSQEVGVNLALFEILGSGTIRVIIDRVCEVFMTQETEKPETKKQAKTTSKAKETSKDETSDLALPATRPKNIPLSSFQTRQWFMDTVMEQDGGLTCGWTLTIKGEPNLDFANAAFHEVARRNEIFRTRYFEGDDMVEQEIIDLVPANVEYLDISSTPDAESKIQDQVYDLIGQPMDLEKGEVYRSRIVKFGESRFAWIFATHHITVDGASRQSFMEQIVACYNDASTGSNSEATAPKLSYVDFTLWHDRYLKSDQVQVDLTWWKNRLAEASRASKLLPFSKHEARSDKSSSQRRVIRSHIDNSVLKRMKRICSNVNVTPFHFILATLRALIFRYTAEEDFTLLVINGERPHPAFEGVIGFFVNIIPLLWKGSFDGSFEELLLEAKTLTMEGMAHSQAPFDAIVDALELGHNPAHFPLGQIALNYQMYAKSPNYTTNDFEIQDIHVTDVPTACELQFEVLEDPKTGLGFTLDYDSFLYGEAEMGRFLENYMTFITSAVRDFRQPVEELEMCGPKEVQFLREVCWTEHESKASWMGQSLVTRWADVVARQPLSTAIKTSDGQSIQFSALDKRACAIASMLEHSGVKYGDRVGVLSHPSIDVMASMLALAFLRCVYVPLDPSAAQGRLEYMIENTSAPVVLHGPELDSLVQNLRSSTDAKYLPVSTIMESGDGFTLPDTPVQSDDVCYIVFTSGSTGKPKGVMVTYENTATMLCGRQEIHSLGSTDIFLQQSSTSFDISMAQTWGSLTSGATMALATKDARQDVDELANFIRDSSATMVYMTPTQLAMILENCTDVLKQCRTLRAVSLIGEHLPPRLVSAMYDLGLPSLTVFNEYGPSESTSQNTMYKVPYPSEYQTTVDIGRPIPNSSAYILNSRGRSVPACVSGELCIGGPQVSLGYLGRASTAFLQNDFVSGVFKTRGWDRLYRTGDMARFRLNGSIDLQGRISGDKQVKLRGHRIDLEEIEAEIRRIATENVAMSTITGALVLARTLGQVAATDMTDDRQLVAFLTTKSELTKDQRQGIASKLHVELTRTLNKYMIPACYQPLTAFPMTVSGKIDRVGLNTMTLDPVFHAVATSTEVQTEEATVESASAGPAESIKRLFSSILKLPSHKAILDSDNFFELGGQSVLALRLQKALKKDLGVKVKLVDIFRNPTPAGLVKRFGLESSAVDSSAPPPTFKAELNWEAEVALPNDTRYLPKPQSGSVNGERSHGKNVLLLGADGYIGYYMLKYLLMLRRDCKVYLLGLGERFNLGDLFAAFTEHQMFDINLSQTDLLTRTEIVQGAMGKEHFGLGQDEFARLGGAVDAIYHTGGFVSLLATYEELKLRNVRSVFDMIELASLGSGGVLTSLHYISTWSIVHVQAWNTTTLSNDSVWLDEQSVATFRPPATNDHGYFKTRWVAEMLMEEAGRRGFPTAIYRCPAHTAPTAAKCATPSDNFTINMCVRMAQTGLVLRTPARQDELESDMGMIPIDYLADTLVRLADVEDVTSGVGEALRLHITNENSLPYSKIPELVAQLHGGKVASKELGIDEWFEAITAVSNENINLELSMYKEYLDKGHIMFTVDDSKTKPLLDKISGQAGRVKCDAVDVDYLRSLLRQEEARK